MKKLLLITLLLLKTGLCAAFPLNQEIECTVVQMSFFRNGEEINKTQPSSIKPVYYQFDGKQLTALYKFANAPIVADNGARYVSSENVKEGGASFATTNFIKEGSIVTRLKFFSQIGGKPNNMTLIKRFSSDKFSSFNQFISGCVIK